MLTTVTIRIRQRQIPLVGDLPPRYGLPEPWQELEREFTFESDAGVQSVPGAVDASSATRRHVTVIAPGETIDTELPAGWPDYTILSVAHTIGGPLLITDPVAAGAVVFNGAANPPAQAYFIEGEEMSTVGKWSGTRRGWWWWSY